MSCALTETFDRRSMLRAVFFFGVLIGAARADAQCVVAPSPIAQPCDRSALRESGFKSWTDQRLVESIELPGDPNADLIQRFAMTFRNSQVEIRTAAIDEAVGRGTRMVPLLLARMRRADASFDVFARCCSACDQILRKAGADKVFWSGGAGSRDGGSGPVIEPRGQTIDLAGFRRKVADDIEAKWVRISSAPKAKSDAASAAARPAGFESWTDQRLVASIELQRDPTKAESYYHLRVNDSQVDIHTEAIDAVAARGMRMVPLLLERMRRSDTSFDVFARCYSAADQILQNEGSDDVRWYGGARTRNVGDGFILEPSGQKEDPAGFRLMVTDDIEAKWVRITAESTAKAAAANAAAAPARCAGGAPARRPRLFYRLRAR